ncbi:hypothetical protein ANN_23579 [Periplaneta americana]|uniref:Uncharacterized protein n=1 Tax=Periplaneta americana TaxID=6978 RepID=A0ABQ8SMR2_PERAM|nr:hypothetical protein ANN_23579 [Periplaneta americana]
MAGLYKRRQSVTDLLKTPTYDPSKKKRTVNRKIDVRAKCLTLPTKPPADVSPQKSTKSSQEKPFTSRASSNDDNWFGRCIRESNACRAASETNGMRYNGASHESPARLRTGQMHVSSYRHSGPQHPLSCFPRGRGARDACRRAVKSGQEKRRKFRQSLLFWFDVSANSREKAESDALAGLKVIEIGPATSKIFCVFNDDRVMERRKILFDAGI